MLVTRLPDSVCFGAGEWLCLWHGPTVQLLLFLKKTECCLNQNIFKNYNVGLKGNCILFIIKLVIMESEYMNSVLNRD